MSNLEDIARAENAKCNMTADEMFDSLIEGTQHKPSIESTNALVTRLSNELSERCMLLLNKANGIKNKKSDELVDFGA